MILRLDKAMQFDRKFPSLLYLFTQTPNKEDKV
jgi:hypothetical protein